MRSVYLLLLLTPFFAHAQAALTFTDGDSLTFIVNSGSMNSGSKKEQLVFVRNGECVDVSWLISIDTDHVPVLQNKLKISWKFLKDTLHQRLKSLPAIQEAFESHSHSYLYVHNNGKPVTIKEKHLKVLPKGSKSKSTYISTLDFPDYIERFFNTLTDGYKKHNTASCQYKQSKNAPEQGEQ